MKVKTYFDVGYIKPDKYRETMKEGSPYDVVRIEADHYDVIQDDANHVANFYQGKSMIASFANWQYICRYLVQHEEPVVETVEAKID